jgi:pimeloyl-ACP methyl ester carboxylesterase
LEPPEPAYIDAQSHRLFSVYHPADQDAGLRTPVLICSPWGWDEVASYRPRRAWAQRLAAAGHSTLRFDLPGTGDSSGSPRDRQLVAAWLDAIRAAAGWLGARSGAREVSMLGLGLGGLLAMVGLESGAAASGLITLAAPASGRSFVRGARNFSRLQAWAEGASSVELPEGWIEASGFLLSAETIAELEELEPTGAFGPSLRRLLILGRRPAPPRNELVEAVEAGCVEVATDSASGWAKMVSHPERSRLAADAAEKVAGWLDHGETPTPTVEQPAADASLASLTAAELDASPVAVTETPIMVDQSYGRSFGILATPGDGEMARLCVVFLNAGAVRNTGPNRMWVERSRAWAARGVPTFRVDLEAIGDANGDPDGIPPGEAFFASKYEAQVERVIDALEARGLGPDFALVGLCSGGYFAFRTARADRRVRAAYVINPGALVWRPGIFAEREAHKVTRVFEPRWVGKLLRGEIEWRKVKAMFGSIAERVGARLRRWSRGGSSWNDKLEADLDRLQAEETRLTLMFSGGEGMADELDAVGFRATLVKRPFVEMVDLPGADHTLRPLESQAALRAALDERLERELAARGWAHHLRGLKSPVIRADDRRHQ